MNRDDLDEIEARETNEAYEVMFANAARRFADYRSALTGAFIMGDLQEAMVRDFARIWWEMLLGDSDDNDDRL